MRPRVSIIIPNYNGEQIVDKLIRSILEQTFTDYELIIVDNNSKDNSLKKIIRELEKNLHLIKHGYRIVKLKGNYGYCPAANIGAYYSNSTDYIVVINNDLILDRDWLKKLVEYMDENSRIGAASSKVIYYSLNRIDSAGLIVDKYGATMSRGFLKKPDTVDRQTIEKISSAHGASIIIRKNLFRAVKGYDNILSMYYDDVDISWRIMLLGHEIGYAEHSICYHVKTPDHTLRLSTWKYYLSSRNRIRVLIKNYELGNIIKFLPKTTILIILRGILQALITFNPYYIMYSLKSLLWNLIHLKDTLKHRKIIQAYRSVNDKVILRNFIDKSLELGYLKILLRIKIMKPRVRGS